MFYVGQAEKVFDRAYTHLFVDPEKEQPGRYEMNVSYNFPKIYNDYHSGNEFSISLIPLENTPYSSLDELEYNAISAYESELPNGYNRDPGNIFDRPLFYNDDYEKAANLILDKIKGTETFLMLSNDKKN